MKPLFPAGLKRTLVELLHIVEHQVEQLIVTLEDALHCQHAGGLATAFLLLCPLAEWTADAP